LSNNIISNNSYTGVRIDGANLVNLTNNTISANQSGGIILAEAVHTVTLNDNIISNNYTGWEGAGIRIGEGGNTISLNNNTITNNESISSGGGVFVNDANSVTLTNNIISTNRGRTAGGGLIIGRAGTINLVNNTINNNYCDGGGGGINILTIYAATLTNNIINNNSASRNSGGVHIRSEEGIINLTNNTISNNSSGRNGGGVLLIGPDTPITTIADIYNNIIWNNNAVDSGADLYIGNDRDGDYFANGTVNLYNNDFDQSSDGTYIEAPFPIDPSNLNNEDPLFVDPDNDDFHLSENSTCKDAGDNNAPELPDTDIDGEPRIINGVVDMGADEYDGCPNDPNKTAPGICGCGTPDTDSDGDGIPDCNDNCDNLIDSDGDGTIRKADGSQSAGTVFSLSFSAGTYYSAYPTGAAAEKCRIEC
jgi:hypothetical protein